MSAVIRLALTVVGTAAYLGLAVVGEGGIQPFLERTPLMATVSATFVMVVVAPFVGGNLSPGVREDRGNRWVIGAFGLIGLVGAYLPAYTDRLGFWTLDGDAVRWIGVALYAVGGVLRLWPVYVLGNRFSGLVAIQRGHTLVTAGIYSLVRNPSYLGLLLLTLGWGLAFHAGVGVLLTGLTIVPLIARIKSEERLLQSQFGAEYDAYRARTWRLIPWIY